MEVDKVATLLIRKLDDSLKTRLRQRASAHGRSMEEEARTILHQALAIEAPRRTGADLVQAFRDVFEPLGGVELDIPPRTSLRAPPILDK
jgi:plasmid stability protein